MVLAGAACGAVPATQPGSSHAAPASQAICRAGDLHAIFRGFQTAGPSLTGAVVVVDAGTGRCWLGAGPQGVTLIDGDGGTMAVKSRGTALAADARSVELLPGAPLPAFGAPPAAGSAWFVVTWTNWCSDATPDVSALVVALADGTVAAPEDPQAPTWVAGPLVPRCDDAHAGSAVTIGRFQAPAH
jgi:hypothetical protein